MQRNPYELPFVSVTFAIVALGFLGYSVQTFLHMVDKSAIRSADSPPERVLAGNFPRIPKWLTTGTYRLHAKTKVLEQLALGATISSTKEGMGSSFCIDLSSYGLKEKKYIITAAHCVTLEGAVPADTLEVEVRSGLTKKWVKCRPVAVDKDRDAALLIADEEMPFAFEMADDTNVGSSVIVGGCPGGTSPSATLGFLTSRDPDISSKGLKCQVWQISVPFFYGNSGGPVIDAETNKVIGILVAGISTDSRTLIPGVAICVPAPELLKMVEDYIHRKTQSPEPAPPPVVPPPTTK